jgi:hypothetical protein
MARSTSRSTRRRSTTAGAAFSRGRAPGRSSREEADRVIGWLPQRLFGEMRCRARCIVDRRTALAACGGGSWIEFAEVQLEGKKRMPASEFLRGYPAEVGRQAGSMIAPARLAAFRHPAEDRAERRALRRTAAFGGGRQALATRPQPLHQPGDGHAALADRARRAHQ